MLAEPVLVSTLQAMIEDGVILSIEAVGCVKKGHLLMCSNGHEKFVACSTRGKKPKVLKSGLTLFKQIDELDVLCTVKPKRIKMHELKSNLAVFFAIAQLNPSQRTATDMIGTMADAYVPALRLNYDEEKTIYRNMETAAINAITDFPIFFGQLSAQLNQVKQPELDTLKEVYAALKSLADTHSTYQEHVNALDSIILKQSAR